MVGNMSQLMFYKKIVLWVIVINLGKQKLPVLKQNDFVFHVYDACEKNIKMYNKMIEKQNLLNNKYDYKSSDLKI